MDWFKLAYTLLGGLGIFFFGMKLLSESLQAVGSQWIRKLIGTLTTNRFMAVVVGLVVTCFVQSSSITTVMVVGFVNAGLMNLAQAIGVIFGANIGTTITGWIISIKIGKYSLLLIGLGVFPHLFAKSKLAVFGRLLFALGLVFLGLNLMSGAFKPLRTNDDFLMLMQYFSADNYFSLWATVLVGCFLTFLVQSSSAMLGITIALASTGSITFQTALALVMGENIGTTITALLAGVGGNTAAKRAGVAHGLFNVLGVFVLTTFFWVYKDFIEGLVSGPADLLGEDGSKPNIAAHIAAGHTVFNVVNVIIFLPFLRHLERLVVWLIPTREKDRKTLEFLGTTGTISPVLAIEQANLELQKMASITTTAFVDTLEYLKAKKDLPDLARKVQKYEEITDRIQLEITEFLGKVMEVRLSEEESCKVKALIRMADEFESIVDYCASIVSYSNRAYSENFKFDEETKSEIYSIADRAYAMFCSVKSNYTDGEECNLKELNKLLAEFNQLADRLKETHLDRISKGKIKPNASLTLSDIIVAFRRIKNHTVNLGEAYQYGMKNLD